jgi:tetratricopeptide (TPR) repeat protein
VTSKDRLKAAITHHRAGRLSEAREMYREILRRRPNDANALHLLGVLAGQQGKTDAAIDLVRRAISIKPRFAEAYRNLGSLLAEKAQFNEAAAAYRKVLAVWPTNCPAHRELGARFAANEYFQKAVLAFSKAIHIRPDFAEAHHDLGSILAILNRVDDAISAYSKAIKLKPGFIDAHYSLGNLLSRKGRPDDAVAACRRAAELKPDFADARFSIGEIMLREHRAADAVEHFRKAFEINPEQHPILNRIGNALLAQGKFDEAATYFRRFLEACAESEFGLGYRNLVSTGRVAASPKDCQRLRTHLNDPNTPADNRVAAGFALGKLLDDAGRFDEAFICYAAANSLSKQYRAASGDSYRPDSVHRNNDRLIAAFDRKCFENGRNSGESSELPVFIVGMPRSGTTLVHQIASSHPQVQGIGERMDIAEIATALNNSASWGDIHAIKAAAKRHLQRLRAMNAVASRIIDKTPGNVQGLGLIALLFPAAQVIYCRREARDTCLSCYFQSFLQGHTFSFDLAHCGMEYLEVERLMNHWRRTSPLKMLEVQYEKLVTDLEGQSRRLINFLGLPWDPTCLKFYRADTTVLTASAWQVRQPIYQSSMGRWRNYQRHLGPLLDVLGLTAEDGIGNPNLIF